MVAPLLHCAEIRQFLSRVGFSVEKWFIFGQVHVSKLSGGDYHHPFDHDFALFNELNYGY